MSLFSRRTGHEYMTKTPGKPLLWRLVLHRTDGTPLLLDNTQQARCEVVDSSRKGMKTIDLTWRDIAVGEETEALSVTARVELPSGSDTTLWSLDIDNHSKKYGLWEVHFPLFVGLSERGMPDVAVPRSNWGYLYRNLATTIAGSYPSADWPMQFLLVNEGEQGLYLAAHDPGAQPKRFSYTPGGEFHFCTYAENMGVPGSSFHSPFPVAVGMYQGNWWRGAKRYRAWALRQPWTSRGPLATRTDTPDAMKNLGLWMLSGGTKGEVVPGMMKAKDFFGVPLGVHWYTWHQIPFDVHYPDYFPTKPGFAQGVQTLTQAGVIAMPYINGRLWDTANEDFAVGRAGACKQPDGKTTYIEEYGSGAKLAPMCPTTAIWQDKVNDIVRRLIHECGVNAIYLDQIAAAGPQLCFDPAHGHPLGGGRHWVDGYRQLLTRVRSQTKGRVGITTENNAEPYMDNVDAFLIWNPRSDLEIPMMTAVYSGYTIYFSSPAHGTYEPGAFRMMQGRDFLWGCQQGWMGFELLEKNQRQNAEYLRNAGRYRTLLRDFLVYGELLCDLKPTVPPPTLEATWSGWGGGSQNASLPSVMGTVWRSREGRGALLISNLSDTPQQFSYRLDPRAWGLQGATQWTLTRIAPASQGATTRTSVALVSPSTARTEALAPREILILEILPTPPGNTGHILAEIRQARARLASKSSRTPASSPRTEVSFLTNPRAGESCVLQARILNGSDQFPTTRLVLDLPTGWEVDPGRTVIVDDLKPHEARVLPFRCEVPAKADGSVFVRANIVTTQPGKRFPVAPPRPVTPALHFSTPPTVDGDLSEWQAASPVVLSDAEHSKVKEWKGGSDLSGRIWTGWDDRCLYLAAQVTDNAFEQSYSGKEMWMGDCLQIGLRAGPSTDSPTYEDVHEFGLALTPKGPEIWKWLPDEHEVSSGRIEVGRTATGLDYEASIPWSEMGGLLPVAGGTIGFSFTINDADGRGFRGWMEWTPGICGNKTAAPFGRMLFVQ
ncbi:MAG: hypothetical protein HY318_09585 [Armatimonadetes bacterium]|nr:hypothetical protein [Armatimonadota bacterium]